MLKLFLQIKNRDNSVRKFQENIKFTGINFNK